MQQGKKKHKFILSIINISIRRKIHYKALLRKTVLVPNTSVSLQTTLAAEAHLV
jgi:hypothetical protein